VAKRFAYLVAAQWLRDGVQALFLLLLARAAVEAYGNFMLAMNLGQILLFSSEFGINQHFMLLLVKRQAAPSAVFRQVTQLKGALMAAGALCMAGFCLWQGYPPRLLATALLVGLSFGLDALVNSYYVVCQSLGRQDVEGRLRGAAALTGYGLGCLGLLAGLDPLVCALAKPVETLVGLSGALPLLRRSWRAASGPLLATLRDTWNETRVFTLMALAAILYNKINVFFLQRFGGAQAVAQYSATWQLVDGISILASSVLLGKVLFPVFARLWVTDQAAFADKARAHMARLAALALPIVFALALESGPVIGLLYGGQYAEAARVQPLLASCVFFAFVHNLCYYLLLSMGRQTFVLWIFCAGLAVNVLLCVLLIPLAPLDGAVWAMAATKALVSVFTVGACQISLRLFRWRGFLALHLAAGGALALALGGRALGFDLAGQALGLLLLLAHLWRAWSVTARQTQGPAAPGAEAPC
jgi:O-antigen/teichoic acid export membrane protein